MVVDWNGENNKNCPGDIGAKEVRVRQASPTASVTMEPWPWLPLERWVSVFLAGGPCSPGPSPWKHILQPIHNQKGPRDPGAAASHPQSSPSHLWPLRPLQTWPWLHLDRSPQSRISNHQRHSLPAPRGGATSCTNFRKRKRDVLKHRSQLHPLKEEMGRW